MAPKPGTFVPNTVLVARAETVHCYTTRAAPVACQAAEYSSGDVALGYPYPQGWHLCGLPAFAQVYGGHTDDSGDYMPYLCWRHLQALGDTGAIVVRPVAP